LTAANEQNPVWYLRGYEVCGPKISYQYFREHVSQFEKAYSLLADNFSKKVFVNVLNAKLSGDFSLYVEIMGQSEYFDAAVVQLTEHEVLLDVGAYKGDVILEFVKQTEKKYDSIIAFEPDKKTLAILEETVAKNKVQRLEIHNKGAWHESAILNFHDGRSGSSRVSETNYEAVPATTIEVDTIDNILHGRRVTYISMDIEGAERNALLGGEQTVKKWKPRIAVCVYHKREDLFDLILLLESFVPGYKFYMRHYSSNQTETVLYAV
jgi:FkbM family methyltransferase